MQSPFLCFQENTKLISAIRVKYTSPVSPPKPIITAPATASMVAGAGNSLSISIEKYNPQTLVTSIEEAEDLAISHFTSVPSSMVFDPKQISGIYLSDIFVALPIMINRAANLIAARTRRGAGNVVLMHPNDLQNLLNASTSAFASTHKMASLDPNRPPYVGRWTFEGYLNSSMTVYTGPVPEKKIIVLYKGSGNLDGPAFYSTTDTQAYLTLLDNDVICLGNALDYVGTIDIA